MAANKIDITIDGKKVTVTKDSFLLQLYLRHESLEMSRRYTKG